MLLCIKLSKPANYLVFKGVDEDLQQITVIISSSLQHD